MTVTSEKDFRMSHLAFLVVSSSDTIDYRVDFMGQALSSGSNFSGITCTAAGISTPDNLPISVKLLEGGVGKTPSPNYEDTLTVTITPLAAGTPSPAPCP